MAYAVPKYVDDKLSKAIMPPGHWFNLFYQGYESDFNVPKNGKIPALKEIIGKQFDPSVKKTILQRQEILALKSNAQIFPVKLISPLAVGLGNEHPVENGFSFLSPYGLPYIAGSGIKGVLRKAALLLASGNYPIKDGDAKVDLEDVCLLFGGEEDKSKEKAECRGSLCCWDAFPDISKMEIEIMTPHYGHYLNASGEKQPKSPHDQGQPTLIPFLVVPSEIKMNLIVTCSELMLEKRKENYDWRSKLEVILKFACKWVGFGAKTAIGYGAFKLDEEEFEIKKQQAKEAEEKRNKELLLVQMSPEERENEEAKAKFVELDEWFKGIKAIEKNFNPGSSKLNARFNEVYEVCAKLKSDACKNLLDEILKFVDKKSKKGKEVRAKINEIFPEKEV